MEVIALTSLSQNFPYLSNYTRKINFLYLTILDEINNYWYSKNSIKSRTFEVGICVKCEISDNGSNI